MTTPKKITAQIQTLEPSAIIELFVLDASSLGAGLFYFHAGTNELRQNVIWQGQVYTRFPINASGFEYSGTGQLPRPKMQVSNFMSAITAMTLAYSDLIGTKVIRRRTMKKFLDAANFESGLNPEADPDAHFPDEIFYIDRKALENRDGVEFELAASFDLAGIQLPRRQIVQNVCSWVYRGGECGYTGTDYFDSNDNKTLDATKDVCGKRLSSCKCRFGASSQLPFGGFPAADLTK